MYVLFGLLAFIIPILIIVGIIYFIVKVSGGSKDGGDKSLTFREVAVDAGIFLSLIVSITSVVSIIFAAIDKKFVDVLKSASNYGSDLMMSDDIRVAVSVVLVVYPIYLWLAYYRAKHLEQNASRRDLPAMKYVNYIILGASGLFIAGSLVTTIYQYLGGELGIAFFYKILTVFIISAALGIYNYFTLKRNYKSKSNMPHVFALITSLAVIGSIIYSISIIGSPAKVRMVRFDEKRLQDLSSIQQEILSTWMRNRNLPASTAELGNDGFNNYFSLPSDPKTKQAYKYKILEDSVVGKVSGQDCVTYYPGKFNHISYPVPTVSVVDTRYEISKANCEMPSKAIFEICANFETVRAYDENGTDQSARGWDTSNSYGVSSIPSNKMMSYGGVDYYDSYNKNPTWNHNVGETCFKRTIDPLKYPQY